MGEGVLYPALHSLETRGLLRARRRAVGGRTRVYYSITPKAAPSRRSTANGVASRRGCRARARGGAQCISPNSRR